MSTLGKAVIEFSAETAKFTGDVGRAAAMFEKNMLGMQRAVDGLLGKLGVAGGIAGLALMTKGAIDLADHTLKASQKLGLTTEQLSELGFAFKLADVEQDSFVKGFAKFEQSLVAGSNEASKEAKIFKALGIDITQGPVKAFRQLADVMSTLPKDSELTNALSRALMGKGGMSMIPGMLEGAKGFDEAAEKARNLGIVISEDFGRKAQQFNDNMKILESRSASLGITIATTLLPVLNDVVDRLAKAAEHGRGAFLGEAFKTAQRVSVSLTPDFALRMTGQEQRAIDLFKTPGMAIPSGGGGQVVGGRIGGIKPREFAGPPRPTAEQLKKLRDALAHNDEGARKAAAELLKYEGALHSLEKQLFSLNNAGALSLAQYEVEKGSLKTLTAAHKAEVVALAARVDARRRLLEVNEAALKQLGEENAANDRRNEILREQLVSGHQVLQDQGFELSLIGKSAREVELLNAARGIELNLRRSLAALPALDEGAGGQESAANARTADALRARAAEQTKAVLDGLKQRQEKERDWLTGANAAFQNYSDAAMNAAANSERFFTNAFQNMEDALTDFAMTGKLDFKKLADSIVADLWRIQVRANVTGPLAAAMKESGGLSGIFGSIFGGGREQGGAVGAGTSYLVGERGPEMFVPQTAGNIVPAGQFGASNAPVFNVDMRGASVEAVARLERLVAAVNGSIESRALGVVRQARIRGA